RYWSSDVCSSDLVLSNICINSEHSFCFFWCIFICCMRSMSFLPMEFRRTQKRACRFFPAQDMSPLVIQHWQVTVGMNVFRVIVTKQHFRSWTDSDAFCYLFISPVCYPGHFRCKTFYMIPLFLQ